MKNYHSSHATHQAPIKKISEHKRKLVSSGLPVLFSSLNKETTGNILLNERGDIIVEFVTINGNKIEKNNKCYLIDAPDNIMNSCLKLF